MTRYEVGFMNKCAEYGLDAETSVQLMKQAGRISSALTRIGMKARDAIGSAKGAVRDAGKRVGKAVHDAGRAAANAGVEIGARGRNAARQVAKGTTAISGGMRARDAASSVAGKVRNAIRTALQDL